MTMNNGIIENKREVKEERGREGRVGEVGGEAREDGEGVGGGDRRTDRSWGFNRIGHGAWVEEGGTKASLLSLGLMLGDCGVAGAFQHDCDTRLMLNFKWDLFSLLVE